MGGWEWRFIWDELNIFIWLNVQSILVDGCLLPVFGSFSCAQFTVLVEIPCINYTWHLE